MTSARATEDRDEVPTQAHTARCRLITASGGWRRLRSYLSVPFPVTGLKRHIAELDQEAADR